jgi:hypothetical protein
MAGWKRARTAAAAWRRSRPRRRNEGPDGAMVLAALSRAWATSLLASALLLAAVAMSRAWDGAVFRHALQDALHLDPQCAQPIDNAP